MSIAGPRGNTIDLLNVDYDDVLHLYRGWRKAEDINKEKDKEINALRSRLSHLESSHTKFRGQIQALESVKELTISLQTQLSVMQQENYQLTMENKEVTEVNRNIHSMLEEKNSQVESQHKLLRTTQQELQNITQRYNDISTQRSSLETMVIEEQAMRMSCEERLKSTEASLEEAKNNNATLRSRLESTNSRMAQCDNEIAMASDQLKILSSEIEGVTQSREKANYHDVQNKILRGDIARLIRLLEYYPAAKDFLSRWQDSEGLSFLGPVTNGDAFPSPTPGAGAATATASTSGRGMLSKLGKALPRETPLQKSRRSSSIGNIQFDVSSSYPNTSSSSKKKRPIKNSQHDLSASTSSHRDLDISISDLNHLRRVHGGNDFFPMTSNMQEESQLWVPREAYDLGMDFLLTNFPHAPSTVIRHFLREINKIWMKKEKRKVKRLKHRYLTKINDLKRKLANSRPYYDVMSERQIRLLRNQLHDEQSKRLKGYPRLYTDFDSDIDSDDDDDEEVGGGGALDGGGAKDWDSRGIDKSFSKFSNTSRVIGTTPSIKKKERELTPQPQRTTRIAQRSAEKLLRASLSSLESLGRQLEQGGGGGGQGGGGGRSGERRESGGGGTGRHPTVEFLQGALWMGRNLSIAVDDASEAMELFRGKCLRDIAAAGQDPDIQRGNQRLSLLMASVVSEAVTVIQRSSRRVRDLVKGVADISPGDTRALDTFLLSIHPSTTTAIGGGGERSEKIVANDHNGGGGISGRDLSKLSLWNTP